jgi:hypothetical protein
MIKQIIHFKYENHAILIFTWERERVHTHGVEIVSKRIEALELGSGLGLVHKSTGPVDMLLYK